jgi:hypothetical protein
MIKVYIASPYSIGIKLKNVRRQIDAKDQLMKAGFTAFCPLLSHYHDQIYPHKYNTWLDDSMEWLQVCDCLLRLKGKSEGADTEENYAKYFDIPVFHSVEEIIKH